MFSLRLWLISLLLTLPLYTYSLNYRPRKPQEDVFEKRDIDEVIEDLEKRQDLASASSVLESISDLVRSITEDPGAFTGNVDDLQASLSSVLLSLSSEVFDAPATTSGFDEETTTTSGFSGYTTGPAETATPGDVITDGTRTGTVGEDGTTRFCSASSFLCPASVNYGCCQNGYRCGLTACTPTNGGGNTPQTTDPSTLTCSSGSYLCPASVNYGCCPTGFACGLTACTPTDSAANSEPTQSKTTFSFDPISETGKGGETNTSTPGGNSNGNGDSGKLSGGAIGGIVGGVLGGLALIGAGIAWFCLKGKKPKTTPLAPANNGAAPPPSEQYTGGPLPPQPQMAQYGSPVSPPPVENQGGYYQPYSQQYPGQQGPPTQGGYPQYGQNVSELGGAAMPYGQKGVEQPQGISEAPANPITQNPNAPGTDGQQQAGGYGGHKGPSGPVYELS